jgi:hypothetical protein
VSLPLAAWMLSACAPMPEYRPPNYHEPHAVVKVRLEYHAWLGPELEQSVAVDGQDVREIPPPAQHGSHVATRQVFVKPGSTTWTIQTTFFHNDVSSHAETYETTQSAPCGSTTCVQSQPHTRQVNRVDRVDDATCTQGVKWLASAGEAYTLQYDFLADGKCSLHCYRQANQRGGAATNLPCQDAADKSTKR